MSIPNREFIRVPPDGAGKALLTTHLRSIDYINGSIGAFKVGDLVVGASSSAQGTVVGVHEVGTTGSVSLSIAHENLDTDFSVGENLEVESTPVAEVSATNDFHVSQSVKVGANNPRYGQSVDVEGAAFVRFAEGAPNFDAAGNTSVSQENWIGIYSQTYDENADLIDTTTVGSGTLFYDEPSATSELQVTDTNGDSVIRQTHLYHAYRAGIPMTAMMTVAAGADTADCVRRWGYFDEDDGLFFEYDGATLYVVKRSSTSGSVVETKVPQSQWNGDRLDGSGNLQSNPSQTLLDPELFHLYSISLLYLGAGPTVFSIYSNGMRTVVHTFNNGGFDVLPYMRTGSLPLRWECVNTAATAGPTQLRQGNSTVLMHGDWAPQTKIYGSEQRTPVTVNGATALAVIRAKQTHLGQDNRGMVLPKELRVISTAEPIHIRITREGDFTVDTWFQENSDSLLEQGSEGGGPPTINDEGEVMYSHLVVPGEVGYLDLEKTFSVRSDGEITRKADITEDPNVYAIVVESTSGSPTDVTLAFNWAEVY